MISIDKNVKQLFLISMLSLFLELLLIRYMGTEILLFQYFKNLTLMAAFLGLGLGLLWHNSKHNFGLFSSLSFLALALVLIGALQMGLTFMTYTDPFEYMFFYAGEGHGTGLPLLSSLKSLAVLLGCFILCASSFVGIGQKIGQLFGQFSPLKAYSINVIGALCGSLLFALLSFAHTGPGIWIVVAGLLYVLIDRRPAHFAIIALGLTYSLFLGTYSAAKVYGPNYLTTIWSPYYRIDLVKNPAKRIDGTEGLLGYDLKVSYDTFQGLVDCRPENLQGFPEPLKQQLLDMNTYAYKILGGAPDNVLILGAGNGTDAAVALRAGAKHVDAVEIDPAICKMGKDFHPEKPYLDSRVHVYNMDARTFLRNTHNKYDLIIFAFLDSHAAFSCLSSLRIDNYIFTKEAYEEAYRHLTNNGLISVSFICFKDWLWDRHTKALAKATNVTPQGYSENNGILDVGYILSGPGLNERAASLHWPKPLRKIDVDNPVPLSTDDWPFLFLPQPSLSTVYMFPLLTVLLASALLIGKQINRGTSNVLNWELFFLGAGFMLLETRALSDLSLLFGSTWMVNTAVISGVMVCILFGNWLATILSQKWIPILMSLIMVLIAVPTFLHVRELMVLGEFGSKLAGVLMYILPIAFASTVFALFFKESHSTSEALAFNLFGGLVGIPLEYFSMLTSVRTLGWIAISIYLVGLVLFIARTRAYMRSPQPEPATNPSE